MTPCPVCGAPTESGDAFCEVCGSPLGASAKGVGKGAARRDVAGPGGTGPVAGATAAPPLSGASGEPVDVGGTGPVGPVAEGTAAPPSSGAPGERVDVAAPPLSGASGAPVDAAAPPAPTEASAPTAPTGPFGRTNPCAHCGAPPEAIDADGYCGVCGRRQPGPRDHLEVDLGWAAGVTDRGHRHPTNQDAFHLELAGSAGDHGVVAVVCDGVSSSVHAEEAAEAAAMAAATVLAAVVSGPGSLGEATVHATDAANKAVAALPWTAIGGLASPSCTLVSAAHRGGEVAVGSVGDSRVYWLGPPDGVRQLTVDDSWAEAEVAAGRMTEEEAEADVRSHAITRWVGADAPQVDPEVVLLNPALPGRLLLCSDGLWNYAPTAADMAEVLARHRDPATPLELARWLTTFALDSGGHDNVTVVVIDLPGDGQPDPEKGSP